MAKDVSYDKSLRSGPCEILSDGKDLFIVFNGERVAKRGQPGTPQAGTWVGLKPGWTVIIEGAELIIDPPDYTVQ